MHFIDPSKQGVENVKSIAFITTMLSLVGYLFSMCKYCNNVFT